MTAILYFDMKNFLYRQPNPLPGIPQGKFQKVLIPPYLLAGPYLAHL